MEEAMSLHRAGPVCGLLFLPLYAAFTFVPELPEPTYSDEAVLALYTDPDKADLIMLGSLFMALAGVVLLVFLADLWRRLRPAGDLATLTVGAGVLYVGTLFVTGTLWGGYAGRGGGPVADAAGFEDSVTLARVLTDMGLGMQLVYGLMAAAVMVAAASAAGRRTGAVPRGVVVAGFVVAPLLLLGVTWVPQFLVPLWVAAVSVGFLRSPAPTSVDLRTENSPAAR
jgi:hypothetical protein